MGLEGGVGGGEGFEFCAGGSIGGIGGDGLELALRDRGAEFDSGSDQFEGCYGSAATLTVC